jgi:Holliday junction resolvase
MGGPEKNLTDRVLDELNSWPQTEAIKKHGSMYGKVGDPDIFGCTQGRTFLIEMKRPGETPSKIQRYRLRKWKQAGAIVGWADTFEGAIGIVRGCQED